MVEIFCDAATMADIERAAADPTIAGVTTNPSLMKKAGITNYRQFARDVLKLTSKPVSFEVLADDWPTMQSQAREIASWGPNVWVKIPVMNTKGESSIPLVESVRDLNLNVTAVMTLKQLHDWRPVLRRNHILSVFAGRITDAGSLPWAMDGYQCKTLWASTREIASIAQAESRGYDIITLSPELLAKRALLGRDLHAYSLETVQQFHRDGQGIEF